MDFSGRGKIHIASFRSNHVYFFRQSAVFNRFENLIAIGLVFESIKQTCIGSCIQNIPHFSFSVRDTMNFLRKFIVGMYLNRKPLGGIKKFDQYRKNLSIFIENLFSDQIFHINFNQFVYFIAFQKTV
ncbi:hypothetical protein SDC9_68865 [bioreactor metagenome]|uniref:Uncharacterized protein n=1 Tax=bioreactor metagenome TaxID=1076179 RepID=A0A644Y1L0_9ZZZZ